MYFLSSSFFILCIRGILETDVNERDKIKMGENGGN
jgi:hypothetical protein